MIDITEKGAALRAASEGRFNELPVHNPDVECCSRERIRAIQLEKLIAQVEWTYERVAWYRDQMDEMGVKPSDIKCLEDVRKLPFTDKHALRKTFPYGMFAVPLDEVVELHSTWMFGTIASCDWCRWRASCLPIACRWRSGTACSPAVSACITACSVLAA